MLHKKFLNIKANQFLTIAIYSLLLLGIYHSSHRVMLNWWAREDYNYCYLIGPIVLYLLWDRRAELASINGRASWPGLIPFATGIFLFWLGELAGEFTVLYISSWFVLVGMIWLHLGWAKLKTIWFPIALLPAMFPLPNFIHFNLSFNLKIYSSQIGVWMLRAAGFSAYRDGNIIDLGFTQLQVVDACSGLRYLFPLMIMGLLLAYFYRANLWKKALLVLSTIPLTILMNSLRIAATGFLYQAWGAEVAEGFFHGFSGWFIFMASLWALLFLMWCMSGFSRFDEIMRFGKPMRSKRSANEEESGKPLIPKARFAVSQFIVAVVALGATLALSHAVEFREKTLISKPFAAFPLHFGNWKGKREAMDQKFLNGLKLTDYVMVNYYTSGGKSVDFYTAYYESQRKGESIHSPETCLPGSGWEFRKTGAIALPLKDRRGNPMRVNKAVMRKGDLRQLAYFWFPQRDRVLTNAWELKWFNFWDALTRQRTDGALVRLITPIYTGEDVAGADARLLAFTREILPVLNEFLPR